MSENQRRDDQLKDKVALITGASRGIGLAIARRYLDEGARVVLVARKLEGLEEAKKELAAGDRVEICAAHVGDAAALETAVTKAVERFGRLDILVNNAGTNPHFGPILTSEDSQWQKTLDVNLFGAFRLAKLAVPEMRKVGGGRIINMASIAARQPLPAVGLYCVTKAALVMLTNVLACELAADNIQVNAIAPGFIKTQLSRVLWEDEDRLNALLRQIPAGRLGEPEEVAEVAMMLASPQGGFVTGSLFGVDGGQHVYSPM